MRNWKKTKTILQANEALPFACCSIHFYFRKYITTTYWSTFWIRHTGQPMFACKVSFSTFSTTSSFIFHFFFKISRHKYSTRQSIRISRHFHQWCYNFFLQCVVLRFRDRGAPHDNTKSIGICLYISPILTVHWI